MNPQGTSWFERRPQRVRALFITGSQIINTIDGGRERVDGGQYLVWDREAPYAAFPTVVGKEDFERHYNHIGGAGEPPAQDHSHSSTGQ